MPDILLGIDLSVRSDRAIRRASLLARASRARLHLLHVTQGTGGADQPPVGELQERLARAASAITEFDGVDCTPHLRLGEPVEQMAWAAGDLAASLIVTGPHQARLGDLIARPTVEKLAEQSGIPVLVANALPVGGYARILAPTGLDEPSAHVLRSIERLPLGGPHELLTVHVRQSRPDLLFNSSAGREEHWRLELEAAHHELAEFLESHGLSDSVRPHARLNRSTFGLEIETCAAELGCDLIAIGVSEKSFIEKLMVGSVAEEVVREVEADLLVFP